MSLMLKRNSRKINLNKKVVKTLPESKAEYQLKLPSQTENLELIREFISRLASKVGFNNEDVNKIELAVDEACTNVIKHAYDKTDRQSIDIAIKIDYKKFMIIITDKGKGFDVSKIKTPDIKEYIAEMRVGGLGIYLMKSLMDEVDFELKPGVKNQVKMTKYFLKNDN